MSTKKKINYGLGIILFFTTYSYSIHARIVMDQLNDSKSQNEKNKCEEVRSTIKSLTTFFKEKKETSNLNTLINITQIEQQAQKCSLKMSNSGLTQEELDQWKADIKKKEFKILKNKIENDSLYKDVKEEISQLQLITHEDSQAIKSFIEKHKLIGIKSQQEEEKSCQTTIDLRNKVLGKVRDQDSVGWCYAFTAADLLSYKLGQKISATDIAINHSDDWFSNFQKYLLKKGEQDFEGGYIHESINELKEKGACLEKNFKSEDTAYSNLFETLKKINTASQDGPGAFGLECNQAIRSLFPTLPLKDIIKIFSHFSRSGFLKDLTSKACSPRIKINQLKVINAQIFNSEDTPTKRKSLIDTINTQLGQKNISAISFNALDLYGQDTHIRNQNLAEGAHALLIVGRKFNKITKQCEYLLRNSWGRGCKSYDKTYKCEEGNVWVPKAIIARSIYTETYIK